MPDWINIHTLMQKELHDAQRNRWYWLYGLVFTVLTILLAWLGLTGLGSYGLAGFGRTSASIINLVLLIVPLMGLTLGAMSLAGEKEQGTLLYLLAQPITPLELLLGKFTGLGLALVSALGFGFGLSGLLIVWQGGTAQLGSYLLLVLFAVLLALASLSVGFLISAAARKSATAISIALFAWLALVFLGDLGLLGTAIVLKLDVGQLFTLAMINPLQIFKIAAVLNIRDSLESLGPAGLYAMRTYGSALLPLLIGILILWVVLPLAGSFAVFRKQGAV